MFFSGISSRRHGRIPWSVGYLPELWNWTRFMDIDLLSQYVAFSKPLAAAAEAEAEFLEGR
jgi:hypothetical protein